MTESPEGRLSRTPVQLLVLGLVALASAVALGGSPAFARALPRDRAALSERLTPAARAPRGTHVGQGKLGAQRRKQGYLVPDRRSYLTAKRAAARAAKATSSSGPPSPAPLASTVRSWSGIRDPNNAPPDTTSAIGTSRYIELINTRFAIYRRNDTVPISKGNLAGLLGGRRSDFITDPQIIWDPGTQRFYYAALDTPNPRHNFIAMGFSKTASPTSAKGFCKYVFDYGSDQPDFPKLGDTADFTLVGVNAFSRQGAYLGSDVVWSVKPSSGSHCPRSLRAGARLGLRNANGSRAWSPVPTNQIDNRSKGWALATPQAASLPRGYLSLFRITRKPHGAARIQGVGGKVQVDSFDIPPNAPQQGSTQLLDTLDSRLTQAVAAVDPSQGSSGRVALWTQHTVAGGAGSEVRWYELDPGGKGLFQAHKITGPANYHFNGAISPDRAVSTTGSRFGGAMAITYSKSSANIKPTIGVVSKVGANPRSAETLIKTSPAPLVGFGCRNMLCRWGDYSGATPDPAAPPGTPRIWMANQWEQGTNSVQSNWRTQNFIVTP
jgi:hypothetical protein